MKRIGSKLLTYVAVALLLAGVFTATAIAGDCIQLKDGTGDGIPDQEQKRDGSCQDDGTTVISAVSDNARGNGECLRDGSCQDDPATVTAVSEDVKGYGDCDRLRDGSCIE